MAEGLAASVANANVCETSFEGAEGKAEAINASGERPTLPGSCISENERLDRMGQATDFRGVAVDPKVIRNLLIAFVHHHH